MERDEMSYEEADDLLRSVKAEAMVLIESGEGYDAVAELLMDDLMLEMDYFIDFLP